MITQEAGLILTLVVDAGRTVILEDKRTMFRCSCSTVALIVSLGSMIISPLQGQANEPRGVADAARPTALSRASLMVELQAVPIEHVEPVDRQAVAREDEQREATGFAPRFAIPNPVSITTHTHGLWEKAGADTAVWRLRISSPGALSLNLGFGRYNMPEGGRLLVYASDYSQVPHAFTAEDNAAHGELWTPVVLSDAIVVEVTIPSSSVDRLELELTSINVGYRGFGELAGGGQRSGSCNVDVICPEGDPWRLDISAIGVISTGGSTFCTGFMVNNTANDLTPYFMTAEHCGINSGNAASLVVYWNYENSYCRTPGSPESGDPGDGSLSQYQTGSYFRATYSSSDVTLVELDEDPDPLWDVSYVGWNKSGDEASSAVAIHHPNTDEKRISFEYQPTTTTTYLGESVPGDGTHVRIEDWDLGTTEPGSSGSPLFDQDHRVIGQLHGGYASCTSQTSDWYGKFAVSWVGGGTSSSRLSDWLDAGGTGDQFVDTISLATLCSDQGEITLDRAEYACDGIANIEVIDCGLNANSNAVETVTVSATSDSDSNGEPVLLTETDVDTAKFQGVVELSDTDLPGMLFVAEGDTVTATYIDADDGQGGTGVVVTDTATVDCTPPIISNVQTSDVQPRSATVTFDTDEPALGSVLYGTSCASLPGKAFATTYATAVVVNLTDLQENTPYFYAAHAEDEAGNGSTDDNGGACYAFTTPDIPDYFTEEFTSNDLDNLSLLFTPNGSYDFYFGCVEAITALPTDPTGGTTLSLSDDDYATVTLDGGATVSLFDASYGTLYPASNGYITFTAGDTDYTETLTDHFDLPRISALFDDLNPSSGGTVSWRQLADRVAVTWENVPEYNTSNQNTFQIEMYFDGTIVISYLDVAASDGIAGLSEGNGLAPDFYETDLSAMGACGPRPPTAQNGTANTAVATPVSVALQATDDGLPDPPAALTYVITSLPDHGELYDAIGGAPINAVPYSLTSNGNAVDYHPEAEYHDSDLFQFKATDGGGPPDGGDSNTAEMTVTMGGAAWDPVAYDVDWSTGLSMPTDVELSASDPNSDTLSYIIESLPAAGEGSLSDPGAGAITTVPHTLVGNGNVVRYYPPYGESLESRFDFSARDATAGSNVAAVTVTVGGRYAVHSFPLGSDPGWTTEGDWAFGVPSGGGSHSGDPTSGHSGSNVYGYNLAGDYPNGMTSALYLTSASLDCSNLSGTELRFQRWLGVEAGWFDQASVQVSTNGSTWTPVWEHTTGDLAIDESSWSLQSYDLSAVADGEATVYVRWGMGPTDGSTTYPGWNLDDIEFWASSQAPPGDFDGDGDVTLADFAYFVDCLSGPDQTPSPSAPTTVEHCLGAFDFDEDADVDLDDYGDFQEKLAE